MIAESKGPAAADVDQQGPPAVSGRPFWPIALLVLGLVLALLGAAVFLDQRYRPRVGIEPAAATAQTPAAAARTAPQLNAPAVGGPLATAIPTTMAAAPVSSAPTSLPATAAVAAPKADGAVVQVAAPPSAAELLTPLKKEIVDAYLRYWDVRIGAFYSLDTSRLATVMAGDELVRTQNRIADLRAQGRGGRIEVDHNFRILSDTPDEATLYDEYVNRSVFIDAATKREMPTDDPPIVRKVSYQMRKLDGTWKVVDGEQHD